MHKIHTHTYAVNLPLDIPDRIAIALATFHFQPIKKSNTTSRVLPYITIFSNKPNVKTFISKNWHVILWIAHSQCLHNYTNHEVNNSFSLEQNSGCSCRQAFIHYCGLHQVWRGTEKLHFIWVLRGSLSMLRTCKEVWKRKWAIIELRGQKGCIITEVLYYYVILYSIILYNYITIVLYYNYILYNYIVKLYIVTSLFPPKFHNCPPPFHTSFQVLSMLIEHLTI